MGEAHAEKGAAVRIHHGLSVQRRDWPQLLWHRRGVAGANTSIEIPREDDTPRFGHVVSHIVSQVLQGVPVRLLCRSGATFARQVHRRNVQRPRRAPLR